MSLQVASTLPETSLPPVAHTSFLSMVRGEFLKIARVFWLMLTILCAGFILAFLLGANAQDSRGYLRHTPLLFLYNSLESNLVIIRILVGIFLLILTSFTIGREYQYGTIRILLARGAGRVQLLLAKLTMLSLIALALLAAFTLLTIVLTGCVLLALTGNLNALSTITPAFWSNIGIDLLTVLISMGATILLATAMNALGRSLTFGLSASLIWFPLDNMATLIMNVLAQLTHTDFWLNATSYFLGPLLNRLPTMLLPVAARSGFESFGTEPLVPVDATHALWVIAVYALLFFFVALVPTWKRDVRE